LGTNVLFNLALLLQISIFMLRLLNLAWGEL